MGLANNKLFRKSRLCLRCSKSTFVLTFRRAHGEVDMHGGTLDVMNSCR